MNRSKRRSIHGLKLIANSVSEPSGSLRKKGEPTTESVLRGEEIAVSGCGIDGTANLSLKLAGRGSAVTGQARTLLSGAEWRAIARRLNLSKREVEVVQGIFDGEKVASIALKLGISHHTVNTHVERLYQKLGVGNRCQLLTRIFAAYLSLRSNPGRESAAGP